MGRPAARRPMPVMPRREPGGDGLLLVAAGDLHRQLRAETETAGLLALMLLTDACRPARTAADGQPIPMAEQDRSLWDGAAISEGVGLITATLRRRRPGPYQLQAAIAAVHDEAPSAEATDWAQILALYELLRQSSGNPVVALNHAVRAQLLEMAGDPAAARTAYLEAARHTTSLPHQRYLHARAARLAGAG